VTFFSSSFFGKKQERRKPGISREYKPRNFPGIQTPGISREYKPQEFPRNTNLRNFFGSYRAGKIPGTGDIQEFPRSGWVLLHGAVTPSINVLKCSINQAVHRFN